MAEPWTGWRVAVATASGERLFFAPGEIYLIEAERDDTLVRTARRALYRSRERIADLAARLPSPPFYRCHASYLVNLARVRRLLPDGRDWTIQLDPPVNRKVPLARGRAAGFRRLMGVP